MRAQRRPGGTESSDHKSCDKERYHFVTDQLIDERIMADWASVGVLSKGGDRQCIFGRSDMSPSREDAERDCG
jgi:hypothetical protein